MAMPWSRAKEKARWYREDPSRQEALNELFNQPARIQREACEAAGRFIPMVQENVKGAQPWVGRARWHFGSYYLWGDVPALMPFTQRAQKFNPDGTAHPQGSWFAIADSKNRGARATKNTGGSWFAIGSPGQKEVNRNPVHDAQHDGGVKGFTPHGQPLGKNELGRRHGSKSKARKAASAKIAKIPLPLAQWIAHCYHPQRMAAA